MNANPNIKVIDSVINTFVLTEYDHAVTAYRENPSAQNWQRLKACMVVLQAWHERKRPARIEAYPAFIEALGTIPLSRAGAAIYRHAHGTELADLDLSI